MDGRGCRRLRWQKPTLRCRIHDRLHIESSLCVQRDTFQPARSLASGPVVYSIDFVCWKQQRVEQIGNKGKFSQQRRGQVFSFVDPAVSCKWPAQFGSIILYFLDFLGACAVFGVARRRHQEHVSGLCLGTCKVVRKWNSRCKAAVSLRRVSEW